MNKEYDIFISYETTTGTSYAENLKKALEKGNNHNCFFADLSIKKGGVWRKERDKALAECKYLIVVITSNTMKSGEVRGEYEKALELNKQIISCRWKSIAVEDTKQFSISQQIEFEDKFDLANKVVCEIDTRENKEKNGILSPREEILFDTGNLFYNIKDYETAEKMYKNSIKINPNLAEAHNNLGNLLNKKGNSAEAEEEYKEAIKINPNLAEAHNNLGVLLSDLGNFDKAKEEYEKSLQINSDFAEAHNNLGVLLRDLGHNDEAEAEFREAISINQKYIIAHNNLGVLLRDLGHNDEAEAEFREAISINPNYAEAHYNLGVLLYHLKRYDEVEEEYRKAIAIKPDDAEEHNSLGILLSDDPERGDEAEKEYKEAIKINPKYTAAYYNLSCLFSVKGNLGDSIEYLKKAIQLDDEYKEKAKEDNDFINIKDTKEFKEIVDS